MYGLYKLRATLYLPLARKNTAPEAFSASSVVVLFILARRGFGCGRTFEVARPDILWHAVVTFTIYAHGARGSEAC